MDKIAGSIRYDISHAPQTINAAANVTGRYFKLDAYRKALFIFAVNASTAATGVLTAQIKQATTRTGTGVKDVTGAVATMTVNAKAKKVTVSASSILAADAITINGLVWTAAAAAVVATRTYALGANDTAAIAALAAAINESVYGVPGVTASASTTTLTLVANDSYSVTIASPASTLTPATIESIASVEVDASQLDIAGGFGFVALNLAAAAINHPCGAMVNLGNPRHSPVQVDA